MCKSEKSTLLMFWHSRWGTARSRPAPKTIPPKSDIPATLTDWSALPVEETESSSPAEASPPPDGPSDDARAIIDCCTDRRDR